MELLRLYRKYFAVMGVEPPPFNGDRLIFSIAKRFLVFTSLIVFILLSCVFFECEAKTLDEYADTFYGFAASCAVFTDFTVMVRKMKNLFRLIEDFEKLIEQRKKRFVNFRIKIVRYTTE